MNEKTVFSSKGSLAARIIKIIGFSLVLCFLMCICLGSYLRFVPDIVQLLAEKKKMGNTIWVVEYGSLMLSAVLIPTVLTLLYRIGRYVPVSTQTDKAIIVSLVFVFTYFVMFASIFVKSEGWMLYNSDISETVLGKSFSWFAVQLLPLLIAFAYHITKASSEKKELEENDE